MTLTIQRLHELRKLVENAPEEPSETNRVAADEFAAFINALLASQEALRRYREQHDDEENIDIRTRECVCDACDAARAAILPTGDDDGKADG